MSTKTTESTNERAQAKRARAGRPLKGTLLRRYGVIIVWVAIIVLFSLLRPETFFTVGNLQTIAGSQAVLLIVTLGLIVPLSAGEFDLSISGTVGIALVLVGWLNVVNGWAIVPTIIVVLAVGILIGAINAFFVVGLKVDSIVVTLGTGTVLIGACLGINSETTGGISTALVDATHNMVLGLPLVFWYALALVAVVWYVYALTPLGRYLYFVGSGRSVARLSGIRVEAIRVGCFIVSAGMASLAGVVLAGWLGAADPNVTTTFLLPAFAAAFLSTSVIQPGRFNPLGTLIAVYFLVTGVTGLQLLGIAGWIEQVFYGGSLVLAVAFSQLMTRRDDV